MKKRCMSVIASVIRCQVGLVCVQIHTAKRVPRQRSLLGDAGQVGVAFRVLSLKIPRSPDQRGAWWSIHRAPVATGLIAIWRVGVYAQSNPRAWAQSRAFGSDQP